MGKGERFLGDFLVMFLLIDLKKKVGRGINFKIAETEHVQSRNYCVLKSKVYINLFHDLHLFFV